MTNMQREVWVDTITKIAKNESFRGHVKYIRYDDAQALVEALKKAFSDYVASEGCGCCEDSCHSEHREIVERLLNDAGEKK